MLPLFLGRRKAGLRIAELPLDVRGDLRMIGGKVSALVAPAAARRAGAGGTGGFPVTGLAWLGHNGQLELVSVATTGGAGYRLGSIQNNLLERLPAIFTNVFVNRHR